jgi:hypothetical protein
MSILICWGVRTSETDYRYSSLVVEAGIPLRRSQLLIHKICVGCRSLHNREASELHNECECDD